MESLTEDIKLSEASHLPIVTAFAQKLGIIEEVDRLIDGQMELSPGRVVLGLILDTLSGRTPLFRLHEFFAHHDTELLLGQDIPAKKFSDDNVGRVLDRIFAVGTQQILGAISLKAVKMFDLELKAVHFDTTSEISTGITPCTARTIPWRLIAPTMRQTLQENQDKVPGWDRKPTDKPTAFMMSTKFSSVGIFKIGGIRRFKHPRDDTKLKYLEILGLTIDIFLKPEVFMMN
jgi:hypothetical protein